MSTSTPGPPDPIELAKRALRTRLRERLRALGPAREDEAMAAQERLLASGLLDGLRCVALYRALPSELSTSLLETTLRARGVRVLWPRVRAAARMVDVTTIVTPPRAALTLAQRELDFCEAGARLVRGPLGIDEPAPEQPASELAQIDAFVLPGLAADEQGNRLGHGRGHYDATLARHPAALRLGLFREQAIVLELPIGAHDQPLDALATPLRFLPCSLRARAKAR